MAKSSSILFGLVLLGCPSGPSSWVPKRDENGFTLPPEIVAIAPEMQTDLFALIRYASSYFPIKPEFVFREEGRSFVGNVQPFVRRLNLIHLVGYSGKERVWSASLMFDPERGAAINSLKGWSLDILPGPGNFEVIWKGATEIRYRTASNQDDARWIDGETEERIFFYYYQFPDRLEDQGSTPGGKN